MMGILVRIGWLNLKRDRVALGLTFVLPVVFFSIFAAIFGGMGGSSGSAPVEVVVSDGDGSEMSRRLVAALRQDPALSLTVSSGSDSEASAKRLVRGGDAQAAVLIPTGFGESFGEFAGASPPIDVLYDPADPVAQGMVIGLLQRAAASAAPDLYLRKGAEMLDRHGGGLTKRQRQAVETGAAMLRSGEMRMEGPVRVRATSIREEAGRQTEKGNSMVAYYAAGVGVMFLLFSMAGAGGSLLEEEENGTLERVLSSQVGMGRLLSARWIFFFLVGALQVVLMFVWGAVVFGLPLWTPAHISGFLAMTVLTAAAAAAFGILLATLCRTRSQLGGVSTIVILIMSALGGSMVPRFVMPEFMNTTALFTFNGWALDGYLKVFWYDDPGGSVLHCLTDILPQLAALLLMTTLFLGVARLFARRWETT